MVYVCVSLWKSENLGTQLVFFVSRNPEIGGIAVKNKKGSALVAECFPLRSHMSIAARHVSTSRTQNLNKEEVVEKTIPSDKNRTS